MAETRTAWPSPARRFEARIQKAGLNPYVEVPDRVIRAFADVATAGRVRVTGLLNRTSIRGSLVPVRGGGQRLYINGGMRAAAGVAVGDVVRLELRALPAEVVVPPDDVVAGLDLRPRAREAFEASAASTRREWLRYIDDARTPANRAQRIERTIDQLLGGTATSPARRRERDLWTCPKCGNRFVTRNMAHACQRHTVDEALAGSPPEIRDLFERFRQMVHACGPVTEVAYRNRVAFMVRVRFAGATPRRRSLEIGFWLTRRAESPRFRRVETLGPMAHIHTLPITSASELDDEVAGWLAEAYAIGRQEHLRR